MPNNIPSIEDLIHESGGGSVDEESTQGRFHKKQQEIKVKDVERLTKTTAANLGVKYIRLFGFPISPEALSLISEEDAKKLGAVCFYYDGERIKIGTVDPENDLIIQRLAEIEAQYYSKGEIYLISDHSLDYALRLYDNLPKIRKFVQGVEIKEDDLVRLREGITNYKSLNDQINTVNISDVVTLVLATAMKVGASDVHIEAEEHGIVVRLRIDGVLQDAANIDKSKWKKIISRMKLLSRVKINIDDKPQDGRFSIFLSNDKVDVRCSFLPTAFGESVVMRLLFSHSIGLPFEDLGIRGDAYTLLKSEIKKPNGLILTTGPTGSGKTTSLYAILNELNTAETKIVTLEDPIEYQLEGINQSQVEEKKGYTFAKGFRSILRQNPDIVMVGEIRDLETAEIAVQASLTGHLVLSTLHTNDASGVIPRLIDMGVKPYFITPSINALVGQRLTRKLCPICRVEHKLTSEEADKVKKILAVISPKVNLDIPSELPVIYKRGEDEDCKECQGLGYKGRIGIYEIMPMSDDLKELTASSAPAFKIMQQAIENGMITMLQDGVLKVMEGLTSLEEVYRVIGKFEYIDTLYEIMMSETIGWGLKISDEFFDKGAALAKDLSKAKDELIKIAPKSLLSVLMAMAIKTGAGDIHVEPIESGVKVRFRIDGILYDVVTLTKEHYIQVLLQVKVLAKIQTNIKKATIDGRFSVSYKEVKIDCRLSIISGGYGETMVVRLLASQASALSMDSLGMRPYSLKSLSRSIESTKGIIITTGPTGSGKTTTLYSILNKLNNSDVKIITVEDPIEYHMEGVMQTQVNTDQGYTFAAAMRSLLRQNPNIMMIGEIRDQETAKIAVEAAMTGHLVLSTIHANSAAGAIARFVGLGVDRQSLANALECSIGQRLVRRICQHCKTEMKLAEIQLNEVKAVLASISPASGLKIPKELKFYKGQGCSECNGLGYKGRIGLYEVMEMGKGLQRIMQGATVVDSDIEEEALKNGAILMMQDGILKAIEGETTVDEIFRVAK